MKLSRVADSTTWNSRGFFFFFFPSLLLFLSALFFLFFWEFQTNFVECYSSIPYFPIILGSPVNLCSNAVPLYHTMFLSFSIGIPSYFLLQYGSSMCPICLLVLRISEILCNIVWNSVKVLKQIYTSLWGWGEGGRVLSFSGIAQCSVLHLYRGFWIFKPNTGPVSGTNKRSDLALANAITTCPPYLRDFCRTLTGPLEATLFSKLLAAARICLVQVCYTVPSAGCDKIDVVLILAAPKCYFFFFFFAVHCVRCF